MLVEYSSYSRHIIQELQKELTQENQRNKVLESENKLLLTEIAQLREVCLGNDFSADADNAFQDMKKLEDTFEQTLMREEQELATDLDGKVEEDGITSQKSMKDLKARYEVWHTPSLLLSHLNIVTTGGDRTVAKEYI